MTMYLFHAGKPRVNVKTGSWHRDFVLEETVKVTGAEFIGKDINLTDFTGAKVQRATRFLDANLVLLCGVVNPNNSGLVCGMCRRGMKSLWNFFICSLRKVLMAVSVFSCRSTPLARRGTGRRLRTCGRQRRNRPTTGTPGWCTWMCSTREMMSWMEVEATTTSLDRCVVGSLFRVARFHGALYAMYSCVFLCVVYKYSFVVGI